MEIWKNIKGFEGLYMVSNYGNIKSLTRKVKSKAGSKAVKKGRQLKLGLTNSGYKKVNLSKDGKYYPYLVHKLVALAFIGERPYKAEINHIDGNKLNNDAVNLEYCSSSYNTLESYKLGLQKMGSLHPNSKLTEDLVVGIKKQLLNKKSSLNSIASEYGVSKKTILNIKQNKIWKHVNIKDGK